MTRKETKKCLPSKFCDKFYVNSLPWNFIYGLESEIPLCCVIEYSLKHAVAHLLGIDMNLGGNATDAGYKECWFHRIGQPIRPKGTVITIPATFTIEVVEGNIVRIK